MTDSSHPRHFNEESRHQIVGLYEAGKPAGQIR
jgi:hypothetical protein